MPDIYSYWRADRPAEGFYTSELSAEPAQPVQPVRTFLPYDYEPRYPYPLLVLFHGRGGNEESVLRLAPKLSRRNFVSISLRGPDVQGVRADGRPACGWGEGPESAERVAEYVVRAVEQTRRNYHIHSERIYLVGIYEGAAAAYRTAFELGERIAGVAALNGSLPRPVDGMPVFRLDQVRNMQVMIAHGLANSLVPHSAAERDRRLLYAAGAHVKMHSYATTHRLHADMLRDLNRWVIGHVNAHHDALVL